MLHHQLHYEQRPQISAVISNSNNNHNNNIITHALPHLHHLQNSSTTEQKVDRFFNNNNNSNPAKRKRDDDQLQEEDVGQLLMNNDDIMNANGGILLMGGGGGGADDDDNEEDEIGMGTTKSKAKIEDCSPAAVRLRDANFQATVMWPHPVLSLPTQLSLAELGISLADLLQKHPGKCQCARWLVLRRASLFVSRYFSTIMGAHLAGRTRSATGCTKRVWCSHAASSNAAKSIRGGCKYVVVCKVQKDLSAGATFKAEGEHNHQILPSAQGMVNQVFLIGGGGGNEVAPAGPPPPPASSPFLYQSDPHSLISLTDSSSNVSAVGNNNNNSSNNNNANNIIISDFFANPGDGDGGNSNQTLLYHSVILSSNSNNANDESGMKSSNFNSQESIVVYDQQQHHDTARDISSFTPSGNSNEYSSFLRSNDDNREEREARLLEQLQNALKSASNEQIAQFESVLHICTLSADHLSHMYQVASSLSKDSK